MSPSGGSSGSPDITAVTELVERVARTVVAPRFRELVAGEVSEKAPGDLVTVVDTEAEAALTEGLLAIAPQIPVVGEEAVSADPTVLRALEADRVWVVDPIDGTRAFVEGVPDYAVMVALIEGGESVAGWICLPELDESYVAERGAGTYLNGARVAPGPPAELGSLVGGIATSYLPGELQEHVAEVAGDLGPRVVASGSIWSGKAYADIVSARRDVVLYWRTRPWDHASGAVLVREARGASRRLDGADYRPSDGLDGLLVTRFAELDPQVREALRLPVLT